MKNVHKKSQVKNNYYTPALHYSCITVNSPRLSNKILSNAGFREYSLLIPYVPLLILPDFSFRRWGK